MKFIDPSDSEVYATPLSREAGAYQYSAGDKLKAQFQLENIIGSTLTLNQGKSVGAVSVDTTWNASDFMDSLGEFDDEQEKWKVWSIVSNSFSESDARQRLYAERSFQQARKVRESMGLWDNLWTGAIAGLTDPIVLATTAVPVLRAGMTAVQAGGKLGALAAGEQAAIETVLQAQQSERTLTESALNIGANAVLGGILGGVGSAFYNGAQRGLTPEARAEQEAIMRGVLSAEEDTDLSWMTRGPGTREENLALLNETDIVGRKFFRGIGATLLNPISRLASQRGSFTARKVGQLLSGTNFATKANLNGGLGTASTTSVTAAVESATGRFAGANMDSLIPAYKEWIKTSPNASRVDGWDKFLDEVGTYYRTFDEANPAETPEWARPIVRKLEENYKSYEQHLVRGGFFEDAFDNYYGSVDDIKKRIEGIEAERATAKRQSKIERLDDKLEYQKRVLRDRENAKNFDPKSTDRLIKDMHGERRYMTQAHNIEVARGDMDGWVKTMMEAETVWYENRIKGLKTSKDGMAEGRHLQREWDKRKKNHREEIEGTWRELVERNDTFNLGGFDAAAGQTKVRKLRIDGDTAKAYLKNNYMDLHNAHMSAVLPRMEMKARGVLPEGEWKAQIQNEFQMMMQGASPKELRKLQAEQAKVFKDIDNIQELLLQTNYRNVSQRQRDVAFMITQFNATRQLGAMLIPSLGDLAGVVAKTGLRNMARAIKPVIKGMMGKQLSAKEAGRMTGIVELVMASRMHALQNSAELGINQGTGARFMGRVSQTFYKATGILWWNQGMKEIAALGFGDGLIRAAVAPSKVRKADKAWMLRDGWDESKLARLGDLYKRYNMDSQLEGDAKVINTGLIYQSWNEATTAAERKSLAADVKLADEYNFTLMKHADRAVVTPGAGDFPTFITQHPFLKLLGQYKGFGAASINKTTIPMAQGMAMGDANMAFGFMGLVALGSGAYYLRQTMYDREITDNWQTMAYEGLLRGGALGLYSDGMAVTQKMTQNWFGLGDLVGIETPSRYYARGLLTDILGPTAGLAEDLGYSINTLAGLSRGEELTDADRAKGLRMVPFNNIFYLRAVLENYNNDS